jgi:hypothetical protein
MSAHIVSLTMLVVASLWRPAPAAACGCAGTIPSSTAARNADVVFVGTVTRIDRRQHVQNGADLRLQLLVEYSDTER